MIKRFITPANRWGNNIEISVGDIVEGKIVRRIVFDDDNWICIQDESSRTFMCIIPQPGTIFYYD